MKPPISPAGTRPPSSDEYEALRLYRLDRFGEPMPRGEAIPEYARASFAAEGVNVRVHYFERVNEAAGAEEAATATKKAWAKAAIEALEEAQSALLNETPEDGMSKSDANADTLEKIRLVLNQPTQ